MKSCLCGRSWCLFISQLRLFFLHGVNIMCMKCVVFESTLKSDPCTLGFALSFIFFKILFVILAPGDRLRGEEKCMQGCCQDDRSHGCECERSNARAWNRCARIARTAIVLRHPWKLVWAIVCWLQHSYTLYI